MRNIADNLLQIRESLPKEVTLVAVSKTKPIEDLQEAYKAGQRIFGENKVQEMVEKFEVLPKDIQWHMIGHLQSNKVKYMASFVALIHGVDSLALLEKINKEAAKNNREIHCLLQLKIAKEDTKFGLDYAQAKEILSHYAIHLKNVKIVGLMGMATFTSDQTVVKDEFDRLKTYFDDLKMLYSDLHTLSMGMSDDYPLAIASGSNMVRIGSAIFGLRNYMI